jgi:hypothetical protein
VLESPKGFWDECSPEADTCRAGAICLAETIPAACKAHCYRYCRTDQDCGNEARCTGDIQLGTAMASYKVCSPKIEPCNPTGPARCGMPAARPFPAFGCYILSSKYPDLAVCECAGSKNEGDACQFEHDCKPGFECVKVGMEGPRCRPLCTIGATGMLAGGCRPNQTCMPFVVDGRPSVKHGFCR